MKKLIAISVMLALITGAVFAEVGGNLRFQWNVYEKEVPRELDPLTNGVGTSLAITNSEVNFKGANEDDTIQFNFRVKGFHVGLSNISLHSFSHSWAKWQVISPLKLYIGSEDGWFGYDSFVGWGYHQGGNDGMAINEWWGGAGNGGGGVNGFGVEIAPIDPLAIYLGLRLWGSNNPIDEQESITWEDVFRKIYIGAKFSIDGVGTINANFAGNVYDPAMGTIGLGFEGSFGPLSVIFLGKAELATNVGIGMTLGAIYDGGDFGVKFRFQTGGIGLPDYKFSMGAQVMPYYKMSMMEIRCNIGVNYDSALTSNAFTLFLNPYVIVPLGGPTFMAGLQVSNIAGAGDIGFAFPLVLNLGF